MLLGNGLSVPGSQAAGYGALLPQVDPGAASDGEVRAKDFAVQRGAGSGRQVIDLRRGTVIDTGVVIRVIRVIGQVLVNLAQVLFRYSAGAIIAVAVVACQFLV